MPISTLVQWCRRLAQAVAERIPQRVVLSALGFMAVVNAYTMRYSVEVALMQMAPHNVKKLPSAKREKRLLPTWNRTRTAFGRRNKFTASVEPDMSAELGALSSQMKFVLAIAFYVGYALSHLPSSYLVERYGGKGILFLAILLTALLTLFTPLAFYTGGALMLIGTRFLMGISEGPIYPALCELLAHWVPPKERGKLGVLALSGSQFGQILINLFRISMQQQFHWSFVFYFFGGCSLLWLISFSFLCYNEPASCPFIRDQEKQYLLQELSRTQVKPRAELAPTPWREIFKSVPVWALITGTAQYDWLQARPLKAEPLPNKKHLPLGDKIDQSADAVVPNIVNWLVSLLSGCLADTLISRGWTTTNARKFMTAVAVVGPNVVNALCHYFSDSNSSKTAGMFNCSLAVMGTIYAGIKLIPLDLSPNYAATVMAIANGFGSLAVLLGQYLQYMTGSEYAFKELKTVFWLVCIMLMSGEMQDFNDPADASVHEM